VPNEPTAVVRKVDHVNVVVPEPRALFDVLTKLHTRRLEFGDVDGASAGRVS